MALNIGIVSQALPYLPSRGGFRLYGGNLIRHLSRRNRIDLVSLLIDDDEEHLDWAKPYCDLIQPVPTNGVSLTARAESILSSFVRGKPGTRWNAFSQMLRSVAVERKWSIVHVEGGYAGGLIPTDLTIGKVLSLHDSWTLRCAEMVKCSQNLREKVYYTALKCLEPRFERRLYPRFERCTVVAKPDLDEVRRIVPNASVDLIPYGTDAEYFHPVDVKKESRTLVFHSHLGYSPNIDAALEFADNIFPLIQKEVPDAVLHLVGANPSSKIVDLGSRRGIRISANLPDLRSAVCAAAVYVCPIRYGTGLKSKMLEAMAMQMPIVGYHPGATVGIACVHGRHLLAATEPIEFAAHVINLLKNPQRAQQLGVQARRLIVEKYSWESRASEYEALYSQVIDEHRTKTLTAG